MFKGIIASTVVIATYTQAEIAGSASVIYGDIIEIHGQRIRVHGVDAPEKDQPCYDAAGKAEAMVAALSAEVFDKPHKGNGHG